jgi:hypothetical protein
LQGANNGGALFVKGVLDICIGQPSGVVLLAQVEEEGDLQASYVLGILKYYKHGQPMMFSTTYGVYDEVTFGSRVRTWWRADNEDDACVMGVWHRVSDEIVHVSGRNTSNLTTSMIYTCQKTSKNVCGS